MAKKNTYRLEALLKIKKRAKRQSEMDLARALREEKEEKQRLESLEEAKEKIIKRKDVLRNEMKEKMAEGGVSIKETQLHLRFIDKLNLDQESVEKEVVDQKKLYQMAKEKTQRARRDYMDAASELNIMEKHKELWQKKLNKQLTALENKKMGELANVIHQVQKMGS